jgi:hypothetical protein
MVASFRSAVAGSAFIAWALSAASAYSAAETVDDIVSRHIQARGGIEKLRAIQTIKITRTVVTPFSTINVVTYKKRPHLYRAEQSAQGQPPTPRGVNLEGAWDAGPGGKAVRRAAALAAETRDIEADFDGLLVDWKEKGHTVTLDGKVPMPPGEAYKLTVKTKSGAVRTIYLDATTYLDRRHTGVLNLPPAPAAVKQLGEAAPNRQFDVVIDYGGWRDVNGVKFPFDISEERTSKEPVQSFVTYTQKIELNVPLEDAFFATPQ